MKQQINKERVVIYILCFILLVIGIFLFLGFKDAHQCLGNPFLYGADKISNEKTGDIHCVCSFASAEFAPFHFNNESLEIMDAFP